MSSLTWRTDFENLEDEDTCLCILDWHEEKYSDCLIWWECRCRFSDENGNEYRTDQILAFVREADLITSCREQFPQQPTTGEKS